jgi:hypothetical protein
MPLFMYFYPRDSLQDCARIERVSTQVYRSVHRSVHRCCPTAIGITHRSTGFPGTQLEHMRRTRGYTFPGYTSASSIGLIRSSYIPQNKHTSPMYLESCNAHAEVCVRAAPPPTCGPVCFLTAARVSSVYRPVFGCVMAVLRVLVDAACAEARKLPKGACSDAQTQRSFPSPLQRTVA